MRRPRAGHVVLACLLATIGVGARAQAAGESALSSRQGALRLDGKPFFPILTWAQCAADVPDNLAVGVTVFMGDSCHDSAALAQAIGGRAYLVVDVAQRDTETVTSLPGVIGWHQPDEPDATGIASDRLPAPRPASGQLTFLTLTSHFAREQRWLTTRHSAAWWRGYVRRADVVGFDLYPLAHLCQHPAFTLASVYREQRDLVALAAGRPTFQWIEASAIDGHCGATPVSAAALRAEVFLALAGGANGIGYFTHSWATGPWVRFAVTPELRAAMAATDADLQALATVLTGEQAPSLIHATGPVLVGARRAGRHLLVIAVNPTKAPVTAQIRFRGYTAGSAQVWNEHRARPVSGARFTDTFGPLQVHIYDVSPGAAPRRR
ncbi:MAG: hypothetical protein QOE29_565 [Gaiellaceae bacterium]|nr:hypothetical protein [Gaiellaceae bacterium]